MLPAAEPLLTADDLVAAAREHGHEVEKRRVTDWVSIGLLDRGTERGRGKGKGKSYLWSENQRRLFLILLDKHGSVSRPVLLNIPVALWLIWGDDYVPLRQVRRAMATWSGANTRVAATRARVVSREVLAELEGSDRRSTSPAQKELRELVEGIARGQQVDRPKLLELAEGVYGSSGSVRSSPMEPRTYVRVLEARLEATRRLRAEAGDKGQTAIADATFYSARQHYALLGPPAAHDPGVLHGDRHESPANAGVFEAMVNTACLHLLTLLGLELLKGEPLSATMLESVG